MCTNPLLILQTISASLYSNLSCSNFQWSRDSQEVTLATSERIVLVCGRSRIGWPVVRKIFILLRVVCTLPEHLKRRHDLPETRDPLVRRVHDVLGRMMLCLGQHPRTQLPNSDTDETQALVCHLLSGQLHGSVAPEATLPVDHVYGLLGIISDKEDVSKYVSVDNSKSPMDVFTQVTIYLYDSHATLMLSLEVV